MQRDGTSVGQQTFLKLKPICVAILPVAAVSKSFNAAELPKRLLEYKTALSTLKECDEPLTNYLFFPISQILALNTIDQFYKHQRILEAALEVLHILLKIPGATLPKDLLRQVWFVCALVLGGPLPGQEQDTPSYKWSADVQLAVVALLAKIFFTWQNQSSTQGNLDVPTSLFSPPVGSQMEDNDLPPPMLIMHTLTSLLDTALASSNLQLQLESVAALETLATFLPDEAAVRTLPGTISTLSKILLGFGSTNQKGKNRLTHSELASRVLSTITLFLVKVIGNDACLEVLQERQHFEPRLERLEDLNNMPPVFQGSKPSKPSMDTSEEPELKGLTERSPAWLRATSQQVHLALDSVLSVLKTHPQASVRVSIIELCSALLEKASETLQSGSIRLLLSELLAATQDEWPQVSSIAKEALKKSSRTVAMQKEIAKLLENGLISLPQTIMSHGHSEVQMLSTLNLIKGATECLAASKSKISSRLMKTSPRWTWSLLSALEFARVHGLHDLSPNGLLRDHITKSWQSSNLVIEDASFNDKQQWPLLKLKLLSTSIQKRVESVVTSLGRILLVSDMEVADHFLAIASSGVSPTTRASAWFITTLLLEGLGDRDDRQRLSVSAKKSLATLVKQFVKLNEPLDEFLENTDWHNFQSTQEGEAALIPTHTVQASHWQVSPFFDQFDKESTNLKLENLQRERLSNIVICTCNALRALTACSAILRVDFRSEFVRVLYPLLAHLAPSTHRLNRDFAELALKAVAYHTSYASLQNMVLANADYLVNSISAHLLPAQLDLRAPSVLISITNICGKDIIPLAQDLVEDIFDSLDEFHSNEALCSTMLAALDTIIRAQARDAAPLDPALLDRPSPIYPLPHRLENLQQFNKWILKRNEFEQELASNSKYEIDAPTGMGSRPAQDDTKEEELPKASRSEAISRSILQKSLYFLSHSSPFLRAKIMNLIETCAPLLYARQHDLLPSIHEAWPLILNRLRPTELPWVTAEAASLISKLSFQVGDFICRRVLEEAWPLFNAILDRQLKLDLKSDLRSSPAFTISTRLYIAILESMSSVVEQVPLREGIDWTLAISLRPLLAVHFDASVTNACIAFFKALSSAGHSEVVWLCTQSCNPQPSLPHFLTDEAVSLTVLNQFITH